VDSYDALPPAARPPFLDAVRQAPADRIRFSALLSEEGGRFYHALNRYQIVEVDDDVAPQHPDYRWLTLWQIDELLQHSHYVNVQARSLVVCLRSTIAG
jgi:oxidase EvaA